jgi:hypothetical protein
VRIFFIFWSNKIHVSPTSVVSFLSPLRCYLSSSQHCHVAALCHAFFELNQDELTASASSFDNTSSRHLISRVETEALNPHYHSRSPSPDHPTPTLHCYKKVILIVTTLSTTQPCLYFVSSLVRAPRHRSFTHRRRLLLPLSHVHRPSTQWLPH